MIICLVWLCNKLVPPPNLPVDRNNEQNVNSNYVLFFHNILTVPWPDASPLHFYIIMSDTSPLVTLSLFPQIFKLVVQVLQRGANHSPKWPIECNIFDQSLNIFITQNELFYWPQSKIYANLGLKKKTEIPYNYFKQFWD